MLENLPDDIIDTSAVALERIANAQAYMNAVLNISESQEADTESTFADIEGDALDELQWQCNDIEWTLNATIHCDSNFLYPILTKESTNLEHRVSGIYYYHPDHLGSATWITNSARVPVEFIHYMPFGELWYNQQASAYNERFKFTGKERDEETGYDYFGARYFSSSFSHWLTVDPLSDKYPNISPYAYCAWNPVKYVDPNRREKSIFTSNNESNPARNFKDDDGIYFFAHGSIKGYIKNDCGVAMLNEKVYSNDLAKYVTDKSNQWKKDAAEGNTSMVFLYACHAGEGDNSLAQQLSEQLNGHDTYVVAPTSLLISESVLNEDAKYLGVRDAKKNERPWGVYQDGKLVTTIRGNKCPNKTTVQRQLFFTQLWNSIKNFFKHDNE